MATRRRTNIYQYEPLVTPSSWKGEEQKFSIRLTQILDDLYQKYVAVKNSSSGGSFSFTVDENGNGLFSGVTFTVDEAGNGLIV